MALQYNKNLLPSTGSEAMFNVKQFLKLHGWTCPKSSDGTTYSATSDILTGFGAGANGLANPRAHFVLQQPAGGAAPFAGNRQICVQRATGTGQDDQQWRIKYAFADMFGDGVIQTVAGASLVDGTDRFTINDGTNPVVTFEFDNNATVTPGNVAVPFTAGDSAATVAAAMVTAINGVGAGLIVTASVLAGGSVVNLHRDVAGTITLGETVASASFTVQTPTALITPRSVDEAVMLGSVVGTDGAPTYALLYASNGSYRQHILVDPVSPFGFLQSCIASGGAAANSAFWLDPLLAGSFPFGTPGQEDLDPYVFWAQNSWLSSALDDEVSGPQAWLKKGFGAGLEGVGRVPMCTYETSGGNCFPAAVGTNPHNGKDDVAPVMYARRAALSNPVGYKGVSTFFKWNGVSRSNGDTLSVLSSKDRLVIGAINAPWDGTVPTV